VTGGGDLRRIVAQTFKCYRIPLSLQGPRKLSAHWNGTSSPSPSFSTLTTTSLRNLSRYRFRYGLSPGDITRLFLEWSASQKISLR